MYIFVGRPRVITDTSSFAFSILIDCILYMTLVTSQSIQEYTFEMLPSGVSLTGMFERCKRQTLQACSIK